MGVIEGIPLTVVLGFISVFGLPGAVLILWYVDNRRYDRQEKKRDKEVATMVDAMKTETGKLLMAYKDDIGQILSLYKEDMSRVTRFYEDNVLLVKNYQRLADDLSGIITLNTQVQTRLVESINNNMFCPAIREKGRLVG